MTLFGWIYLVMSILGGIYVIGEIGKPREPKTAADASLSLLMGGLSFWALYVWGLHG